MVEDLIRRARRRFLLNESLAQLAFAAAVTIGGFVLLLLIGTRYMEWWTLGLFALAGIAVGFWRVYQRTPDSYTTALRLDENARLQDTLSTALYFSQHPAAGKQFGSEEFLQQQRQQAETATGTVRLEEAAPFLIPRSLYSMAAMCVIASALIALRFGVGHGLDLRAPITQFFLEDQAARDAKKQPGAFPKSQKQWMQEAESLLSKLGMGPKPNDPTPGDPDALDKAIDQALQNPPESDAKNQKGTGSEKGGQSKEGAADEQPTGDPIDNGEQSSTEQSGSQGSDSKGKDANSKASSGKNGSSGSKESLLSRLKDAVSNMLSKSDKDENSSSQKSEQSAKNSPDGSKGQPGKGDQQKSQGDSDAQDGQPDADGQSGQQAQGKLNSKSDTKPGQGGSGIGSQDGSKEIKEAAQLKAMGKISEIIGQRAATVSGETSIEVESGTQKLHTAYSNTTAAHVETDGDVTRDEIPLALQAYVQQYFAEVRKTEPSKQKPAAK
jgi:hypothetical protein